MKTPTNRAGTRATRRSRNVRSGGIVAPTLARLREERLEVEALLARARRLADEGEDSKFEKLRAVLRDSNFAREKFIVFTEHRDTAEFLVRRLEGPGFTGQVALIHGGLDYREREAQVELLRRPLHDGGANYLVGTDAAGEGINLQCCWLVVNYDVPWNPARLEQRMGRIHRYGQRHDPVVIVNLVAGETREGRVLKTLLDPHAEALSENEWAKACNLREGYWLYAVYDCATPRPRLVRVRDPFAKLLARSRVLSAFSIPASSVQAAAAEANQRREQ